MASLLQIGIQASRIKLEMPAQRAGFHGIENLSLIYLPVTATVRDGRLLRSEDREAARSSLLALQQKSQSDQSDSNTPQPMKRPPGPRSPTIESSIGYGEVNAQ